MRWPPGRKHQGRWQRLRMTHGDLVRSPAGVGQPTKKRRKNTQSRCQAMDRRAWLQPGGATDLAPDFGRSPATRRRIAEAPSGCFCLPGRCTHAAQQELPPRVLCQRTAGGGWRESCVAAPHGRRQSLCPRRIGKRVAAPALPDNQPAIDTERPRLQAPLLSGSSCLFASSGWTAACRGPE